MLKEKFDFRGILNLDVQTRIRPLFEIRMRVRLFSKYSSGSDQQNRIRIRISAVNLLLSLQEVFLVYSLSSKLLYKSGQYFLDTQYAVQIYTCCCSTAWSSWAASCSPRYRTCSKYFPVLRIRIPTRINLYPEYGSGFQSISAPLIRHRISVNISAGARSHRAYSWYAFGV